MFDHRSPSAAPPAIPGGIDDVDPAWLSAALSAYFPGVVVDSFAVDPIGIGVGLMGLLYRITPVYSHSDWSMPETVIVKLPVRIDATRQVASAYRFYEKEVAFYRELAPLTAVRTVQAYYGAHDPDTDDFVLVLEDARGLRTADQIAGCDIQDARSAMIALARHHGSFWNDPDVGGDVYPWLPFGSDAPTPQGVQQGFGAYWASFVEFMGDRLDPDMLSLGEWVPEHAHDLLAVPPGRPVTVMHGDYRLDNLFFDERGEVTVIDWQIVTKGVGGFDFAYFVSQSLSVAERRAHLDDLAATYLGALEEVGIEYDEGEFWSDVRRAILFGLAYPVQCMALDLSDPRASALVHEMARRSTSAIADLGALQLVG